MNKPGSDPEFQEIASSYLDVWGKEKAIDPEVRTALAKAMGPARKARKLELEPGRCYQPEVLEQRRLWGFMAQLYGLRSERNWGIGDFTDLRTLIEIAASLGAAVVGVNPLHATQGSPYSPSSRHALNVLYIDVEAVPGYEKSGKLRKRLQALRDSELVDYEAVRRVKLDALERVFQKTKPRVKLPTKGLRDFAVFEALREKFGGGWQGWPRAFHDPGSKEVKAFAKKHAHRVSFHAWLQWIARQQLEDAQRRARDLGMPLGLYVDLALGADRGGAEVWSDQDAYAVGASCGAPPDEFNPLGQDWGLPPYSPRALRAKGYQPFIDLLRANMPPGGALRMDHVMALSRLWWIPQAAKPERGGYVNYPFRELLAILAAESRRARCLVIGEDLGTVPAQLRAALNEAGVLSYRPLLFEKDASGEYCPPGGYPREALVCVTTHDLPTWRGYWAAHDLQLRRRLGLTVDFDREIQLREAEKRKLARALQREGLDQSARSAHAFIARTPAKLAMLQPEDVVEMLDQANLPGTVEQHPNWRRKLPLALERWRAEPRVAAHAEAMAGRSVAKKGAPVSAPVATYRLQFHKDFRFRDAQKLVPYLASLGISHLYASPFLKARPGSTHGYDVIDHNSVNPEIGTEAELKQLIKTLNAHGMGMVLDLVPNHMGVLHADNAWWLDVLEKGRASPYAKFFDIDWARGKLLLPVLGKHYGEALEELKLERKAGKWSVRYFDHRFPLNAKSTRNLSRPIKDTLELHRLLEKQYYRLAYWRVASDEINYRRFFEITDLAGVRMEDRTVFEATHGLVSRLAKGSGKLAKGSGGIDGVRIDHPDGLADPKQYFERLSELFPRRWIVLEKILADHEKLPEDWPVHGETGYRFVNLLSGLFIDGSAESRFDRIYQRFTGERRSFGEIARESRFLIMATTLAAELYMLSNWLARIAAGNRYTRDHTASGLRKALAEIAAQFPVYRTYVSARGVSDADRRVIESAVHAARRASRIADPSVFDFVRSVLTMEAAPASGRRRREMLDFSMRFQQFTAPVVAKGVEDTAFYRYTRLIALNEVGGHPSRFGFSLKEFHAAAEERARRWPYTMLGSSTHDTKRSEDVRARLAVLSELASGWRMTLRRWSLMNRTDTPASRSDEYHFYQALVGIWPGAASPGLIERLKAYMLKSAREAKERTSWINPDADYEAALERFVEQSLQNSQFILDVKNTVSRLAHLGLLVGLSQALVKVASPGVPDYYQGTELWDFSLVDPDNRRPVDYGVRANFLKSLGTVPSSGELLKNLADGRAKLHIIRKGLEVRKKYPALFHGARYTPLYADGGREGNIVAFALSDGARSVIAVAPRLFSKLMDGDDLAPLGAKAWGEARLPMEGQFVNVLTGERHEARGGHVGVSELLATFPAALLVKP